MRKAVSARPETVLSGGDVARLATRMGHRLLHRRRIHKALAMYVYACYGLPGSRETERRCTVKVINSLHRARNLYLVLSDLRFAPAEELVAALNVQGAEFDGREIMSLRCCQRALRRATMGSNDSSDLDSGDDAPAGTRSEAGAPSNQTQGNNNTAIDEPRPIPKLTPEHAEIPFVITRPQMWEAYKEVHGVHFYFIKTLALRDALHDCGFFTETGGNFSKMNAYRVDVPKLVGIFLFIYVLLLSSQRHRRDFLRAMSELLGEETLQGIAVMAVQMLRKTSWDGVSIDSDYTMLGRDELRADVEIGQFEGVLQGDVEAVKTWIHDREESTRRPKRPNIDFDAMIDRLLPRDKSRDDAGLETRKKKPKEPEGADVVPKPKILRKKRYARTTLGQFAAKVSAESAVGSAVGGAGADSTVDSAPESAPESAAGNAARVIMSNAEAEATEAIVSESTTAVSEAASTVEQEPPEPGRQNRDVDEADVIDSEVSEAEITETEPREAAEKSKNKGTAKANAREAHEDAADEVAQEPDKEVPEESAEPEELEDSEESMEESVEHPVDVPEVSDEEPNEKPAEELEAAIEEEPAEVSVDVPLQEPEDAPEESIEELAGDLAEVPVEKPLEEPEPEDQSEPAIEAESVEESVEALADVPIEVPLEEHEESVDVPEEEHMNESESSMEEEPEEQLPDESAELFLEAPLEVLEEESVEELAEETAHVPEEELVKESAEESVGEVAEEPVEGPVEEPYESFVETVEEPSDEFLEEPVDDPAEGRLDDSAEETQEPQLHEELVEESTAKPVELLAEEPQELVEPVEPVDDPVDDPVEIDLRVMEHESDAVVAEHEPIGVVQSVEAVSDAISKSIADSGTPSLPPRPVIPPPVQPLPRPTNRVRTSSRTVKSRYKRSSPPNNTPSSHSPLPIMSRTPEPVVEKPVRPVPATPVTSYVLRKTIKRRASEALDELLHSPPPVISQTARTQKLATPVTPKKRVQADQTKLLETSQIFAPYPTRLISHVQVDSEPSKPTTPKRVKKPRKVTKPQAEAVDYPTISPPRTRSQAAKAKMEAMEAVSPEPMTEERLGPSEPLKTLENEPYSPPRLKTPARQKKASRKAKATQAHAEIVDRPAMLIPRTRSHSNQVGTKPTRKPRKANKPEDEVVNAPQFLVPRTRSQATKADATPITPEGPVRKSKRATRLKVADLAEPLSPQTRAKAAKDKANESNKPKEPIKAVKTTKRKRAKVSSAAREKPTTPSASSPKVSRPRGRPRGRTAVPPTLPKVPATSRIKPPPKRAGSAPPELGLKPGTEPIEVSITPSRKLDELERSKLFRSGFDGTSDTSDSEDDDMPALPIPPPKRTALPPSHTSRQNKVAKTVAESVLESRETRDTPSMPQLQEERENGCIIA